MNDILQAKVLVAQAREPRVQEALPNEFPKQDFQEALAESENDMNDARRFLNAVGRQEESIDERAVETLALLFQNRRDAGILFAIRARAQAEHRPSEASLEDRGHDQPCAFCGRKCNSLAGDPGEWPIALTHPDGTGVVKWHCMRCIFDRVHNTPRVDKAGFECRLCHQELGKCLDRGECSTSDTAQRSETPRPND